MREITQQVERRRRRNLVRAWLAGGMLAGTALAQLPVPEGTLAQFRFDGSFVNSQTNTPALEAKTARYTEDRTGQPGFAFLAPQSGFVGSTAADFLKNRRSWTWLGWIRVDDPHEGATGAIYSEGNNGISGQVAVYQRRIWLQTFNEAVAGGWSTLQTEPVLRLGEWVHLAVTLATAPEANVGNARIYLNGSLAASGSLPFIRVTGSRNVARQFAFGMNVGFFHGGQTSSPYQYFGAVDDVLIVDRELSAAEIRGLIARPEALGVAAAVELFFPTQAGRRYRLEGSADLKAWVAHGEPVTGTGAEVSVFASSRDGTQRYWRLVSTE